MIQKLTLFIMLYVQLLIYSYAHVSQLPNGLHYEWTMKALLAGKHVLLEKPSSNTAEETCKMFDFAASRGLVLLEAFHYRYAQDSSRRVFVQTALFSSGSIPPFNVSRLSLKAGRSVW